MERENTPGPDYKKRIKNLRITLGVEIFLTLCIAVTVIITSFSTMYNNARQAVVEVDASYDSLIKGYTNTFKAMVVQIKEKIAEDPSFEEMNTWLQQQEKSYQEAFGTEVYDGIALTYKGGFAHSWNYGDYSDYDPNTRPWYQQAVEANGEVVVVAPYITYLDASYFEDDEYILMTIAQQYNDEISFDLDLKLRDIRNLLNTREMMYSGERIFIFDQDGYILSSTSQDEYAHNIFRVDEVINQEYSEMIKKNSQDEGALLLDSSGGKLQYLFFHKDDKGNTVCLTCPFSQVFIHDFLIILVISLLMLLFEVHLYYQNKGNALEFMWRDKRLKVVADTAYQERVYVNVDDMTFSGNDRAAGLCRDHTYQALYDFLRSLMVEEAELPLMESFLSPEIVSKKDCQQYVVLSRRFMMNLKNAEGEMQTKTVEVNKMLFRCDRKNMMCIAMRDASESVDLLKAALKETQELKEKEEQQKLALEDAFQLAKQGSQAKGSFLSKMSHEIRTPLNAIIGYLAIARDSKGDPGKIEHCIDNSEIASKHLLQIINDVLDMSSIESGKMKIANEDFDLKKEISDITTIFYQNAKGKGIRFETKVTTLQEEWVVGDQLRLNQVLMNLLSNAVKFTPKDGLVTLTVRQMNPDDDKNQVYVQFRVSDTGIGMSQEYLSRLFQPFEQESATTAQKYGGSGLGLSITNNLIHMMGGNITVDSEQNKGTTFTVTMHFGKSQKQSQILEGQVDYSHVRALVVDDQKNEAAYVKSMLKRCKVKSDIVSGGADALKRIESRMGGDYAYDLCILDWNMPDMDGVETAREIREKFGADLPIIIATAYDVTEIENEAKQAGVNKVIAKPLFQSTLFDLLVSTFGKYDPKPGAGDETLKVDMKGVRVILAEDNEMNMEIAVTILEKTGVQVDQAVNGQEAYDLFVNSKAGTYDLILMDIQMPVLNGYQATRKIRQSDHAEAATIPIIAMTANAFAEDVAEALSNGMSAHISKPVNYEKLFSLLQKFSRSNE